MILMVKKILFETEYDFKDPAQISSDGLRLALVSGLHEFNGTTYTLDKQFPYDQILFFKFLSNNSSLLISTPDNVIVFDFITDKEIARYDFNTPDSVEPLFDEQTGNYWYRNGSSNLQMLNVNTGEVKSYDISNRQAFYYANNHIFSSGGFAYPTK